MMEAARAAGREWWQQTPEVRRRTLSRLAATLATKQDDLVAAITQDTGKPALDALGGDVLVTLEHMRYYHHHAHKLLAPRGIHRDWLLFHSTQFVEWFEPHGVVLVYGPSNYPLQLSMVPAITALYAGNAVVLKLSEQAPRLTELLRQTIVEAQLPEHLLQITCDQAAAAGSYIDARPDFVCFTGSCGNGAQVAERAARLLIPTLMELGGKDAAIVFSDCHLERSIEGLLYGAFANSGQVCVGIKRLYVEQSLYATFLRRLTARIAGLSVKVTSDTENDLAPLSSKPLLQRLQAQIRDALARGAEVVTDSADLSGASPLVLSEVPCDALLLQEESFGPVLCVFPFKTEAEVVGLANDSKFALGASIWTSDLAKARRVASKMRAANIAVNDVIRNIANPAASFGGNQSSGYGRYHGPAGLFAFSRTKSIMYNKSTSPRQPNWFPFTAAKYEALRKIIQLRHQIFARLSRFLGIAMLLLGVLAAQGQQGGHIHIRVTIPGGLKGQLAYSIFNSSSGFPQHTAKAFRHGFLAVGTPTNDIDLGELPKGRYAVSLYLDENGNHKLDSGWLGIPKEPVGVSRNPRPRMGPPRFDDSVFEMGDKDLTLEITMVKPR